MNDEVFDSYMTDRYRPEVEWYNEKSKSSKFWNLLLQSVIIVFSGVTPALAIVGVKALTAATGSLVFVAAAMLKLMKFDENWVNYRTICETLKKEPYLMQAGLSDYAQTGCKRRLFVERVESLISREHTLWLQTTSQKRGEK